MSQVLWNMTLSPPWPSLRSHTTAVTSHPATRRHEKETWVLRNNAVRIWDVAKPPMLELASTIGDWLWNTIGEQLAVKMSSTATKGNPGYRTSSIPLLIVIWKTEFVMKMAALRKKCIVMNLKQYQMTSKERDGEILYLTLICPK